LVPYDGNGRSVTSLSVRDGQSVVPIRMPDLISHPVAQRGDPVVLSGADLPDRPIHSLHSSDIHEIAPLLRDGDMLLTTPGAAGRRRAG
jgi:purine catabolism regulator